MILIKFECDNCLSCNDNKGFCYKQYQVKKDNLINMIANCTDVIVKHRWLLELSNADYECMESECISCPVLPECTEVFSQHHATPECKDCFGDGINSGYDLCCNGRCVALDNYRL